MKWLLRWGWIVIYAVLMTGAVLFITALDRETAEPEVPDKITLTFRHFWVKEHDRPMLAIFEDVVREYQNNHPNVKVNFEGIDQTIHRERKLKSEMVTGTPPDLFVLFGGAEIEPYVRSNRLMDLTEFAGTNGLTGQFKDLHLWTFDGQIYGLPIEGNAEPLYFNKAIFNKLGIKVPETVEELHTAMLQLKSGGYIPVALGNEDRWPAAIMAHYLMDRYAGPHLIESLIKGEPGASFADPAYRLAFAKLAGWSEAGMFSPDANNLSTESAVRQFTGGRAAMYLNGNWDINLFHDGSQSSEFERQVGVIPFPVLNPGDETSIAGGYTIGVGLSSSLSGPRKTAALELLQALYTTEVQTRIVYEGLRIPSMRISFDPARTGPVFAQVLRMMEEGRESFVPYDNLLSPEVKKSFLDAISQVLNAESDAAAALDQIQAASKQYWELIGSSGSQ